MKKFEYFDWRRLIPRYWLQNDPTDYVWDHLLNKSLDLYEVKEVTSPYLVSAGPFQIWVSNWPHAYGKYYGIGGLPTVKTRLRLREAVYSMRSKALCAPFEKGEAA
jgi:hypothetical protein